LPRPRFCLDVTYTLDPSPSGVALYSRAIAFGIARAHRDSRFTFYFRPHRYFKSFGAQLPPNASRGFMAPIGSLFHGLNQRLPRFHSGPAVVTFHDLFVLTGEYSTPEFRARFAGQARDAAARADMVIAISEFTRGQVISLLGVEPARVRVVHHGARALTFPGGAVPGGAVPDRASTGTALPDKTARQKVILNVGAIQKRKNIARLVEAFEAVDPAWRLVLIGSSGYGAAEIHARIAASPARERISVLGYVTPEDLAAWYARAMVFAFPSLDEGFGMPLLEAMTAGTPVLTSTRSALPEVVGEAALLADPEDTGALAHALQSLTRDEELRARLARLGVERARLFTWEKAVDQTWEVYLDLLAIRGQLR
jgi:glycosyltransferase involved in cell wall biosynthesis